MRGREYLRRRCGWCGRLEVDRCTCTAPPSQREQDLVVRLWGAIRAGDTVAVERAQRALRHPGPVEATAPAVTGAYARRQRGGRETTG